MKIVNNVSKLILTALIISLVSCGVSKPFQEFDLKSSLTERMTEAENLEVCLPPIIKSSLPLGENVTLSLGELESSTATLPPLAWEKAEELPFSGNSDPRIELIKPRSRSLTLWFRVQEQSTISFWTYSLETQKWNAVASPSKVDHYFFDSESQLWFIVEGNVELQFYKIDQAENKLKEMLIIDASKLNNRILDFAYSPDHSLWVIMSNPTTLNQILVNLDLQTGKVTDHVTLSEYIIGVDTDEKGNVFSLNNKGVVERFNPKAKTVSYTYLSPKSSYWNAGETEFFFTETGQVYLNDLAWFENDDYSSNLHLIFRSTVFVTQTDDGSGSFVWESPEPQAETEDGRIWYKSMRGLAWHQPETGEWCMFTSAKSNIVKDSQGNLWIIYDNALYMLPASETSKQE
ncbi:MAG: hypothetical protein GX625_22215 [Clostridiaceae bacterium]|jgi:hypothetical protein|nr:hypothetical protein [Clostridiaceae bacterium]